MQTSDPEIQFGPIPEEMDSDVLSSRPTVPEDDIQTPIIGGGDASTPVSFDLQKEREENNQENEGGK